MFEFKKLSDVEVVAGPTKYANVLIEENGVIKRAPKTAVGGNGGWDARFFYEDRPTYTREIIEGGYDRIFEKLENKEMPKISLFYHAAPSGDFYLCSQADNIFMWNLEYGEEIKIYFNLKNYGEFVISLDPNGIVEEQPQ